MAKKITTYQDLISTKKDLKQEVNLLEDNIKSSNIVQFSNLFINGKAIDKPNLGSFHLPHVKDIISSPLGNVVSSFLLSNKKIRKYFIAFVIVRETVPYAITEIKKLLEDNK